MLKGVVDSNNEKYNKELNVRDPYEQIKQRYV
jgi:hypothetical protein